MNESYFTSQNAMKRFYYIHGLTADDFYTDSGKLADLEWLLFKELQKNGYERVVFYDRDWKLYCYDDVSYDLMIYDGKKKQQKPAPQQASAGRPKGLKKGKWGSSAKAAPQAAGGVKAQEEDPSEGKSDFVYEMTEGPYSGIRMQRLPDGRLHGGMQDNESVYRQINAYMLNDRIRTAVVINDASDFVRELGMNRAHSFSNYSRLPSYNRNILVFIFPDSQSASLLEMTRKMNTDGEQNYANQINICHPNALELENMLNYFRMNRGLSIRLAQMPDIAVMLRRYMLQKEKPVRIKELYHDLNDFVKTGKTLTLQNCHEVLGNSRILSGEEQLNKLIGMQSVKEELLRFKRKKVDSREILQKLTSSRVRPDKSKEAPKDMMHVVLTGNPGTGKTTVASLLGQLFHEMGYLTSGHVVKTGRSDLVAGYVGQTAIKTRAKVMEALGGVLFIDEAYSLKRNEEDQVDFGQEAIDTLVDSMTEFAGQFIVVAAGYKSDMERFMNANEGLNSRFRLHLHIDDYNAEEMRQILEAHLQKKHCRFSREMEEKLPDFCENWVNQADENWGNAREAANLASDLALQFDNDPEGQTTEEDGVVWNIIEESHIPDDKKEYLRPVSDLRGEVLASLHSLIGLSGAKKEIEQIRLRMLTGAVSEPGHYIFTGNPGTGKTTVARYMGKILRSMGLLKRGHLVEYTAGELITQVQQGRNRVKTKSFEDIVRKALDGVLFIDEAYQLNDDPVGRQIINDLVPFMENNRFRISVIVAGYEDDMEQFLNHNVGLKSRFNVPIYFENYTGEELFQILLSMLSEQGLEADEEYQELSLRVLTRYAKIHGKDKDFGNARYVRGTYIPRSIDARNLRLYQKYGEAIPEAETRRLTGADIPAELSRYAKGKLEKKESKSALEEIESLIGFEEVKKNLKGLLELGQAGREEGLEELLDDLTFHWVLKGNPGTGKTTVAKMVGKVYKEIGMLPKGHCVKVTRGDLVAGYEGQTAIKTKKCIEQAMGGVLFIDEAYMLKRDENFNVGYGQEAIDTILEAMSDRNGEFAVIAAGYPKEMDVFLESNPGFTSRFSGNIFMLPDYNAQELSRIFLHKCKSKRAVVAEDLKEILVPLFENMIREQKKGWANGREAENLERAIRTQWAKHRQTGLDEEGNKTVIYSLRHLPDTYRKYLRKKTDETQEGEKRKRQSQAEFRIPQKALSAPADHFAFFEDFAGQEQGLVLIHVELEKGSGFGSGFMITSDGYIMTCHHVVGNAKQVEVRLRIPGRASGDISWHAARVVRSDQALDLALLKIDVFGYPALPIASKNRTVQPGEEIYLLGYPFGSVLSDDLNQLRPNLFQGYVASVQVKNGYEMINTDMAGKSGCSGGPVFSKKDGTIIGLFCGSQTKANGSLVEELNYVRPAHYIWETMIQE